MVNRAQKEAIQAQLKAEQKTLRELKQVYKKARQDCGKKIAQLNARKNFEPDNLQTIIYQERYQKALIKQIDAALKKLETKQYDTIADFIDDSYTNGYTGVMYDLHKQGIPVTVPIDQEQVATAVQIDSKISKGLYTRLGEDVTRLKNSIRAEVSRGIANGSSWIDVAEKIAKGMNSPFDVAMNNSIRIARTEGHRVQQSAALDAQKAAKEAGADIVKQWDAALDQRTRPAHAEADGQIREVDEPFDVGGEKLMKPGDGSAANAINCRCCILQRAKWALTEEELQTLKDRANYYGLDKSDQFEEFKNKYLQLPDNANNPDGAVILNVIGRPERKAIKSSKTPVKMKLNGIDCEASYRQFVFSDGTPNSSRSPEGAFVFKTSDGVEFIFREKMNAQHQTMTPEKAIELWGRVPQEVKDKAQKRIQFVDYYNPQDSYWKKVYKNFPHSYATGGSDITFYRYDYPHDDDYVIRTFCHEGGHFIDKNISLGTRFCEGVEWTKAMADDKIVSGKDSPTTYGKNAKVEDFAESVAEYVADQNSFKKYFPNRARLLKRILGI